MTRPPAAGDRGLLRTVDAPNRDRLVDDDAVAQPARDHACARGVDAVAHQNRVACRNQVGDHFLHDRAAAVCSDMDVRAHDLVHQEIAAAHQRFLGHIHGGPIVLAVGQPAVEGSHQVTIEVAHRIGQMGFVLLQAGLQQRCPFRRPQGTATAVAAGMALASSDKR